MTIATHVVSFGEGGREPYELALREDGASSLYLESAPPGTPTTDTLEVGRFRGPADATERALVARLRGPLLDIGCGPGRMLSAASDHGLVAVGVDVSTRAVELARLTGSSVLHRSVFGPLPWRGAWRSALLLDGNIGIGGDPDTLLARCRELLRRGGELVVETHPDRTRLRSFECSLVDERGRRSGRFPWAEVGAIALEAMATRHGFEPSRSVEADDREFRFLTRMR